MGFLSLLLFLIPVGIILYAHRQRKQQVRVYLENIKKRKTVVYTRPLEEVVKRRDHLNMVKWKDRDDFEELFQLEREIALRTDTMEQHWNSYPGVYGGLYGRRW